MDETDNIVDETAEEIIEEVPATEQEVALFDDLSDKLDAILNRFDAIETQLSRIAEVRMASAIDNGAEFNDSADGYIGVEDDSVIEIPEVEDMDLDI